MTDIREELAFLISSLNASKFRELITAFSKAKYKSNEVFITDGPYDGGLDLEVRINGKTIKRNIQITVQKENVDKKLENDLKSAVNNVKVHSYMNKLDFYYSQSVTRAKEEEWKTLADSIYDISLTIYDSNVLAQLNDQYPIIKEETLRLLNIKTDQPLLALDEQTKILFDVLSLGKETGEIKKQFIYSYIFSFLLNHPCSTIEAIMESVNAQLPDLKELKTYRDVLSALKGKGDIITDESKKLFSLSSSKFAEVTNLYEGNLLQEGVLRESINQVLLRYGLESHTLEIVKLLLEAYKENYAIDLEELAGKSYSIENALKKIYDTIQKFLTNKNISPTDSAAITKELFSICNENTYLNKIGASILFVNLYKSNRLEDYLNRKTQYYYLDTQVLLRLLCYQYIDSDYDDIYYQSVKNLYETIKSSQYTIELGTSLDYLNEVAAHIQEALKLQRFFLLPIFEKVKTSQNVFFNYYTYLQKSGIIDENMSLEEFFIEILDMEEFPDYNDFGFVAAVGHKLKRIYEMLNVRVIYHGPYEHFYLVKKEYELALAYQDKYRSPSAIDNDLRMILYLSGRDKHINHDLNVRSEPFIVTWDKLFYDLRKSLMTSRFQNLGFVYWYIYSPPKLADRLSVMNFKLNPKSIDYNIISLTESNYNITSKTGTFLDILSTFFNKKNVGEIQLANKLIRLEAQLISEKAAEEDVHEKKSPLVDVLLSIRKHYSTANEKYKFNDVITLFEINDYENAIYQTFEKSIKAHLDNDHIDDSLFISLNKLLTTATEKGTFPL